MSTTSDLHMAHTVRNPSRFARGARPRVRRSDYAAAAMIGLMALPALATAGSGPDLSVVRVARAPVFVDLHFDGLPGVLDVESGRRGEAVSRLADAAADAAALAPDRMIVLRPADLPLEFDRLPEAQADVITRWILHRSDAANLYETAVSETLLDLVREVRNRGVSLISIADLPLETVRGDTATASEINGRYGAPLDELDALVSSRSFILS
ncbi:MAG: hypothetical protein ACYTGG_12485, partial [Planctomycetota bacterium]